MSNRWKKKKARKRKRSGWIAVDDRRTGKKGKDLGLAVQQSCCGITGEVFVRPLEGRFRDFTEEELTRMIDEALQVFHRAGHAPVLDPQQPLWMQAEFLDNMLDFELNPPCGCPSELGDAIKLA